MNLWKKQLKGTAIDWAGAENDPFGTNHLLDAGVIEEAWKAVYPELESTLDNNESKAAIISVVCAVHSHLVLSLIYLTGSSCSQQLAKRYWKRGSCGC